MVWPRIHLFGSGFGHSGSTSKRGACTAAAPAARPLFERRRSGAQGHEYPRNAAPTTCCHIMPTIMEAGGAAVRGSGAFAPPRPMTTITRHR